MVHRHVVPRRRRGAAVADGGEREIVERGGRALAVLPVAAGRARAGAERAAQGVSPRAAGRGVPDDAGAVERAAAVRGGGGGAAGAEAVGERVEEERRRRGAGGVREPRP